MLQLLGVGMMHMMELSNSTEFLYLANYQKIFLNT